MLVILKGQRFFFFFFFFFFKVLNRLNPKEFERISNTSKSN